jgi:hypothetical protein
VHYAILLKDPTYVQQVILEKLRSFEHQLFHTINLLSNMSSQPTSIIDELYSFLKIPVPNVVFWLSVAK